MNSAHHTLDDTKSIVNDLKLKVLMIIRLLGTDIKLYYDRMSRELYMNLRKRGKAVGGATSTGNNIELWFVFFLIDTHNKRRSTFTNISDNNLLSSTLVVYTKATRSGQAIIS